MTTSTVTDPVTASRVCDPASALTRSLLAYGVLAGPLYVGVSLTQAFLRTGFDPTRHEWSLLANGTHGWIQTANLVLAGVMSIAFAAGLRRALSPGRATRWAPRLIGGYGVGLIAAGAFRADPALGFPVGTPESGTPVTWVGVTHFAAAAVGFGCLAAATIVMARRYAAEGRRGWAANSAVTAVAFLSGFFAVASGAGSVAANLAFTAAVIWVWAWMAAVALDRYRSVDATRTTA